jgi:Na+/H+ antiporter NhaC
VASGCDHIEHVRTQLPYALLVGFVAIFVGTIPGGFGVPPWLSMLLGIAVLLGVIRLFGRKASPPVAARS